MYADWASLQDEIQFDQANKSVLHKFPSIVGREVACTVVKHIAQNLSISVSLCDPSDLDTDADVKWTMEVNYNELCFCVCFFNSDLNITKTNKNCQD